MKNKAVSWIMLTLLLVSMLLVAFEIKETVCAEPSLGVTFDLTYYYPDGYVPGVPIGDYVAVDVYVDASALPDLTQEGMIRWGLYVIVDPSVLTPVGAYGGDAGYFLYDWSYATYPPPLPGMPMQYSPNFYPPNVGPNYIECVESFIPLPPLGAGGTGKLCTLYFQSVSETAYSPLVIEPFPSSNYQDATGSRYEINAVNGHYNQPVCIRADGSVEPDTAPISSADNITYTFTDNIYRPIIVERDNIIVDGASHTLQGIGIGTGIFMSGRSNVTLKNMETKSFWYGIGLYGSSDNRISGNNITANNRSGIGLWGSSGNTVSGNSVTNNGYGIGLYWSSDNRISGNNITNNRRGISVRDSSNSSISGNTITDNGNGIYLDYYSSGSISGNTITDNGDGIVLADSSHIGISGNTITDNRNGIQLSWSFRNSISGNNITANDYYGILLNCGGQNSISGNNITNNECGIYFWFSSNGISGNNITDNEIGIYLDSSSYSSISGNATTDNGIGILFGEHDNYHNSIYHNNFVDNTKQVTMPEAIACLNVWDDGYPSGGNYWSDHVAVDDCCGVDQDEPGSDGIVDEPYVIDEHNCDNYPLVEPWSPKTPSPVEVTQELIETIETWNLPKGTETSLTSLLDKVVRLIGKGNEKGTTQNLIGLINKVEALEGKKLTDEQASHLIAEAQRIVDLLKG